MSVNEAFFDPAALFGEIVEESCRLLLCRCKLVGRLPLVLEFLVFLEVELVVLQDELADDIFRHICESFELLTFWNLSDIGCKVESRLDELFDFFLLGPGRRCPL